MKCWLLACGVAALSVAPTTTLLAQDATGRITGVVTSEEGGGPIAGATLSIVGARQGAIAGSDGRYTITLPPGTYRVRASMIGYAPLIVDSVPVTRGQTTPLNFQLKRQALQLSAVVTVGYGTQSRRDVTGSVGSVSAQQIQETPKASPVEALKGRVPGVDIVTTGYKPGDEPRVRIRGQRSLTASNDPLYVLDGIPMAGGLNDVNPTDIESVEVLKDASATAIYGSRGANGVVLITTRRGRTGNTRVTLDSYYGLASPLRRMRMFNGPEFAEYKREAYRNVGKYKCPAGVMVCEAGDADLFYPVERQMMAAGQWTDWQDLVLRDGAQGSQQLSVSGGNDRTQFAVSGSLFRQDGIIKGQDFDRKSMRLNVETQAHTRFRVGGSALVSRSDQNLGRGDGVYSEALLNNPNSPAFDSLGALIFRPTPDGQRVNPLSDVANHLDNRRRTRAFGTLFADLNILEGLNWRVNFGPDITYATLGRFRGAETQAKFGSPADALQEEDRVFAYTLDNIVSYKRDLWTDNRIDATFLYSIQQQRSESHNSSVSGLPYEHQQFYNIGSGSTIESVSSGLSEWSLMSYMGRVNYALKDRYLLTLTARMDGSSRLAPGNKWALFPSVALGWIIGDEPWIRDRNWFSNLKLRASYGTTGNTSVSPYQTQGGLARTTYAWGDAGAFGYRPNTLRNPALQWEKTDQYDVGLEFGVLKGRVNGTVDVYRSYTHDLLMNRQLPASTGYSSILQNIGETQNTGVELALNTVVLDGWKGVRWNVDLNWSRNRNEILSLYGGKNDDIGNRWFIGQPINGGGNSIYYDLKFGGIWQLADSLEAKRYGQVPGQIRVVDQNDDGKINELDRVILGNTYPGWTGAVNTRVDWKRLDLSVMALARQNVMIGNEFRTGTAHMAGRYNNLHVNYWTPTNPSNTDPRPNADQENPIYGSTRQYEDGSFWRIRNITLGFTVPQSLTRRVGSESLRIYGTAQDPFLFSKSKALDPEGRTSAGVPSFRTLLVGVTAGF